QVRRSVLIDSGADILLYGNAERALAEVAHQLAIGKPIDELKDIRGTAVLRDATPEGWTEIDSSRIDWPSKIDKIPNPYEYGEEAACATDSPAENTNIGDEPQPIRIIPMPLHRKEEWD